MSNAIKCDRCSAYFDYSEVEEGKKALKGRWEASVVFRQRGTMVVDECTFKDLCDRCKDTVLRCLNDE